MSIVESTSDQPTAINTASLAQHIPAWERSAVRIPAPPLEDEGSAAQMEDDVFSAPVEDKVTAAPVEDKVTATPVEDKVTAAPMEDKFTATPVEDKITATPMEDKVTAAPIVLDRFLLQRLVDARLNVSTIAATLGVERRAVTHRIKELGIVPDGGFVPIPKPSKSNRKPSASNEQRSSSRRIPPPRRPSDNPYPNTRSTDSDLVAKARSLREQGKTMREIQETLQCSRSFVSMLFHDPIAHGRKALKGITFNALREMMRRQHGSYGQFAAYLEENYNVHTNGKAIKRAFDEREPVGLELREGIRKGLGIDPSEPLPIVLLPKGD